MRQLVTLGEFVMIEDFITVKMLHDYVDKKMSLEDLMIKYEVPFKADAFFEVIEDLRPRFARSGSK